MARYATIDWDVNGSPSESQWTIPDSFDWTEHDGGGPTTDGTLDSQWYERRGVLGSLHLRLCRRCAAGRSTGGSTAGGR